MSKEEFIKILEEHDWGFSESSGERYQEGLKQSRRIAVIIAQNLDLVQTYMEYGRDKKSSK